MRVNTVTDELTSHETALRQAVMAARFDDAQNLLNECLDCIERRLGDVRMTVEETRALGDRAHALFGWTHAMLMMARDNQAAELARLRSVHNYSAPSPAHGRSSTA